MCSYANKNLGCIYKCVGVFNLEEHLDVLLGKDSSMDYWHSDKGNCGLEIKILNWVICIR